MGSARADGLLDSTVLDSVIGNGLEMRRDFQKHTCRLIVCQSNSCWRRSRDEQKHPLFFPLNSEIVASDV